MLHEVHSQLNTYQYKKTFAKDKSSSEKTLYLLRTVIVALLCLLEIMSVKVNNNCTKICLVGETLLGTLSHKTFYRTELNELKRKTKDYPFSSFGKIDREQKSSTRHTSMLTWVIAHKQKHILGQLHDAVAWLEKKYQTYKTVP